MSKTIIVAHVKRDSVQWRHEQVITVNAGIPDKQKNFKRNTFKGQNTHDRLCFEPDFNTRRFKTGLEELIVNPFLKTDDSIRDIDAVLAVKSKYGLSNEWDAPLENIIKQPMITHQTLFEILDGVLPNHYTSNFPPGYDIGRMLKDEEKTFVMKFFYTMKPGANVIKLDLVNRDGKRDRFAWKLINNHSKVATEGGRVNTSKHMFYILREGQEIEEEVAMLDKVAEAIVAYQKYCKEYPAYTWHFGFALANKENRLYRSSVNDAFAKKKVYDYINDKRNQLEKCNKLIELQSLSENNPKKFLCTVAFALATEYNILNVNDGRITWNSQHNNAERISFSSASSFIDYLMAQHTLINKDSNESNNGFIALKLELVSLNKFGVGILSDFITQPNAKKVNSPL